MKELLVIIFIVWIIGYIAILVNQEKADLKQKEATFTENGMIRDFKLPDGTRCIVWSDKYDARVSGLSCDFSGVKKK